MTRELGYEAIGLTVDLRNLRARHIKLVGVVGRTDILAHYA